MIRNWHPRLTRVALPALLLSFTTQACSGPGELDVVVDEPVAAVDKAVLPPSPTDKRYVNFFATRNPAQTEFNWMPWANGTRSVQIAGKTIVFDAADEYKLYQRIKDGDVTRLDIYAEKVIVRRVMNIPGAEVHIHAKELRFEDVGTVQSLIDTTPMSPTVPAAPAAGGPAGNGLPGMNGGEVFLSLTQFHSQGNKYPRFRLNGGKGQAGGQGKPGVDAPNVTTLKLGHPSLVQCAKSHGVAKNFVFKNGTPTVEPSPLTANLIEFRAVDLGKELPTDGTSAVSGGKPGNAGNGGALHSNLTGVNLYTEAKGGSGGDWAGYFAGGSSGKPSPAIKLASATCSTKTLCVGGTTSCFSVKRLWVPSHEERTPVYGASFSSPYADVSPGATGATVIEGNPYAYLHPHAVAMSLAFIEDAYLNRFRDLAVAEITALDAAVDAYQLTPAWQALSLDDRSMLEQKDLRIETLVTQLESREDYFGNPDSWTPALSIEATKLLFEQETKWAIKTIYLADWLTATQDQAVNRVNAIEQAKTLIRQEIAIYEKQLNDGILAMPQLQADAQSAANRLLGLQSDLQAVENLLIARANANVAEKHKVPWWKKGLRILASVARIVPVGQPFVGAIGGPALDLLANMNPDDPWETIKAIPDVAKQAKESLAAAEAKAKAAKAAKDAAKPEEKKTKDSLKQTVKDLYADLKPVIDEAKKHKDMFKTVEAPKEEVAKELEKLKAEDPEFVRVTELTGQINAEREQLAARIVDVMGKLETAASKLGEAYLQLSEFLPEQEDLTEVLLTQRAMMVLGDMRAKAEHRLLRYHYLMSRSYEYAMLQSYPGDLTLTQLFNEILALVNATNADGKLSESQYDSLYTLFREEISALVEEVVAKYADLESGPADTHLEVDLTAAEIASLNQGMPLNIDFAERGVFGIDEENMRLSGIEVVGLTFAGASPQSPNFMDFTIEHNGLSRFFYKGVVHVFKHYNKKTRQPLRWVARNQNGSTTMQQPSASVESLLRALIDDADAAVMLFARPSPWAKFTVRTTFHTQQLPIATVRLRVNYEVETTVGSYNWQAHQEVQNAKIGQVFVDMLNRTPTSEELRSGRELLDLGYQEGDVEAVVYRIYEQEVQGLEVDRIYTMIYSRMPSNDERSFWAMELVKGRPMTQVEEYVQLITDAIHDIYNREPTISELKLYTKLLDQGLQL